jgi:hypothetical protein
MCIEITIKDHTEAKAVRVIKCLSEEFLLFGFLYP